MRQLASVHNMMYVECRKGACGGAYPWLWDVWKLGMEAALHLCLLST